MKVKNRKIKDLINASYNPRYLTEKQEEELLASLKKFGMVSPIIININPERENIVIGGHQRLKLWAKLGKKTIPAIELNLSEKRERELNIRLNKNGGEFDLSILKEEFEQEDLKDWGFEAFEIGLDEFIIEDETYKGEESKEKGSNKELVSEEEEEVNITVAESKELIYIAIELINSDRSMGWEEIQNIKDRYYPDVEFVEIYPKTKDIVNNANVRHLFHIRGALIPSLGMVEEDMDLKYFEHNNKIVF